MVKKYKTALIIFTVALVLRLVFAFLTYGAANYNSENFLNSIHSDGYYDLAYNLIHYKIFSLNSVPPILADSTRTPGYPLIIAASLYIFNSLWPLVIIQIIIGSILPILGRLISREIIPNNKIIDLVGWLLAIEPMGIMLSTSLITETIFTLFLFLFIYYIVKFIKINQSNIITRTSYKIIGLAALLLGITTLIRPTMLYLPVILITAWCSYRYLLKTKLLLGQIIIFLLIFILTLGPWLYRNYQTFGVVAVSSIKEDVMFNALVPSVLAVKNHEAYAKSQINFYKSKGLEGYPTINLDNAGWYRQQVADVLKQNPKEFIIVAGISLFTFFTHDGMLTFLGFLGFYQANGLTAGQILAIPLAKMLTTLYGLILSPAIIILLMRFLWILIAALFFIGIISTFFKKKFTALSVLALIFVAYFALTTISNGFGVNARFRFPVNLFIFMFAAEYLFKIINFLSSKFYEPFRRRAMGVINNK